MKIKKYKQLLGFSLIEIMLAFGIMIIANVVLYATYRKVSVMQKTDQDFKTIKEIAELTILANSAVSHFDHATLVDIVGGGIVPARVISNPATNLITNSTGGSITFTRGNDTESPTPAPGTYNTFAVVSSNYSPEQCVRMSTISNSFFDAIKISNAGGSNFVKKVSPTTNIAFDVGLAAGYCAGTGNDISTLEFYSFKKTTR